MAAIVITIKVRNPKVLDTQPLVLSFIIFLLFAMCKTIAIRTGDVNPYKIAV